MKNDILIGFDEIENKYTASLWGYRETPSGSIRTVLLVSSKAVFDSAEEAATYLYNSLTPEAKANTNKPD